MNTERSVCMLLILEKSDQIFSIKEASCPGFPSLYASLRLAPAWQVV